MATFFYRTIKDPATGLYKEKGSKFLAFAHPVSSQDEIKEKLEQIRKKYFDARHRCFAWMLGAEMNNFRAFDDGEPNHSAGHPILGQIRSKSLTNILVVVVRYFGGVKLGVGGLVHAYRSAAEDAISNASIVVIEVVENIILTFDYLVMSDIMRLKKEFGFTTIHQHLDDTCELVISIPLAHKQKLVSKLTLMVASGKPIVWKVKVSS